MFFEKNTFIINKKNVKKYSVMKIHEYVFMLLTRYYIYDKMKMNYEYLFTVI